MPKEGMNTSDVATVDVMNQLAGLRPDAKVAAVRALRPDVVRHTQGSYDKLLAPKEATGLTHMERAQVALRVAALHASPTLQTHYRQQLTERGATAEQIAALEQRGEVTGLDSRMAAIMRHVDLITRAPGAATPADLRALEASGLSGPEIVTLAQLIAFLSFQVRVLPVVSLLAAEEAV